jgi:hypothetical protein
MRKNSPKLWVKGNVVQTGIAPIPYNCTLFQTDSKGGRGAVCFLKSKIKQSRNLKIAALLTRNSYTIRLFIKNVEN